MWYNQTQLQIRIIKSNKKNKNIKPDVSVSDFCKHNYKVTT